LFVCAISFVCVFPFNQPIDGRGVGLLLRFGRVVVVVVYIHTYKQQTQTRDLADSSTAASALFITPTDRPTSVMEVTLNTQHQTATCGTSDCVCVCYTVG
jgi:hypothetical protein